MPTYEEIAASFLDDHMGGYSETEVESLEVLLKEAHAAGRAERECEFTDRDHRDQLVSEVIWSGREREKLKERLTEAVKRRETAEAELERLRSVAREATGS